MEKDITKLLGEIFAHLGIKPTIEITKQEKTDDEESEAFDVKITGEDLNFLIGTRGLSLDALQTIAGLILYKRTQKWMILNLDINGYKDEKIARIEEMVKKYIDKVRFFQKDIELPPMSPWERRLVHMFVKEYPDVHSESSGEGLTRHVVLSNK